MNRLNIETRALILQLLCDGMSIRGTCRATGVSKNTLSRLANDHVDMVGISVVDRLCDYFDCQPGDLFVYVRHPDKK